MYSLTSLRAFDLVARFGTFTEAARELNVSRPAVSKQIKNLEQHLCCQLVVRSRPKVVLTEEGRQLAAGLKQGFDLINTTAQRITERRARSNAIHVLVDRDFATSWLAERVGGFLIQNPGILVEVSAERNGFLRMDEDFSFRIFYGPAGAFASEVLEEEELCEWIDLPLCTQEYSAAHVSDGTLAPTTHFLIDSNYNPWETWFRRAKIPDPGQGAILDLPAEKKRAHRCRALVPSVAGTGSCNLSTARQSGVYRSEYRSFGCRLRRPWRNGCNAPPFAC